MRVAAAPAACDVWDMLTSVHEWLVGLTRPEDPLLWAWVAIVAGYAGLGGVLAWLRNRPEAAQETVLQGPAAPASPHE